MSSRPVVPAAIASAFALLFFGLGNYLAARQTAESDGRIAALRAEIALLKRQQPAVTGTSGSMGAPAGAIDVESRASIVEDVKRQLQTEMGLFPVNLMRERREELREGLRRYGRLLTPRVAGVRACRAGLLGALAAPLEDV